jgi:hypothetical protein
MPKEQVPSLDLLDDKLEKTKKKGGGGGFEVVKGFRGLGMIQGFSLTGFSWAQPLISKP